MEIIFSEFILMIWFDNSIIIILIDKVFQLNMYNKKYYRIQNLKNA